MLRVREVMAAFVRHLHAFAREVCDIAMLHDLISDGTLDPAPLCSIVMGVKYGF